MMSAEFQNDMPFELAKNMSDCSSVANFNLDTSQFLLGKFVMTTGVTYWIYSHSSIGLIEKIVNVQIWIPEISVEQMSLVWLDETGKLQRKSL